MKNGDEWGTEQALFDALHDEFGFVIDLAASSQNKKCPHYMSKSDDALAQDWLGLYDGYGFLNPPFSRGNIEPFMAKVVAEKVRGAKIVTLTRLDNANWFANYVMGQARQVRLFPRRVRFQGAPSAYNFPCCVAVFDRPFVRKTDVILWDWKPKA